MYQTCSKEDILKGLCHSGSAGIGIILLKQPQEWHKYKSEHLVSAPLSNPQRTIKIEDDALIEMQGYSNSSGIYINKCECPLTKTNQLEPHTECLDFLRD